MARPKAKLTKQLELISARCGLTPKHLRTLHSDGMPLDLEPALAWLNHRPAPDTDGDSASDLRRERIRLIRAQSEKAELELSIRRNTVLDRAEVRQGFAAAGQAIRAMLLAIEGGLIPKLHGKQQPEMQKIARDELRIIMTEFQDHESSFWSGHKIEET